MSKEKIMKRAKEGMTLKELKDILNSHSALDNSKVRVAIETSEGGSSAPIVGVDAVWVYNEFGMVIFLEGLQKGSTNDEIQDNYLDYANYVDECGEN